VARLCPDPLGEIMCSQDTLAAKRRPTFKGGGEKRVKGKKGSRWEWRMGRYGAGGRREEKETSRREKREEKDRRPHRPHPSPVN